MDAQALRVVITGASAGVGRATAIAFGRNGARVGLIARSVEALESACAEVEAAGGVGLVLAADVSDDQAVEEAAARFEREFGGIDVWVNSAMVTAFAPCWEMTPAEFRRITEVTYLGYVYGTMAALRRMRPRNQGTIVQVGSALAYRAIPLQSAYCGAKFAIRGFTDSLRSELLHEKSTVRLTMVQLPAVNTPQFDWARNRMEKRPQPVPPITQPEPVAEAIVRAAKEAPRELWVGGSSVRAILGALVVPHWLDRFLARVAYSGQMADEPAIRGRPDNLFRPLAPDAHQTRGRFSAQARPRVHSFSERSVRLALLGVASVAVIVSAVLGRRSVLLGRR